MQREKSCGSVILRRENGRFLVLLVQNKNGGHWAFPKGHVEGEETETETAVREVREETGLSVKINTDFRKCVQYSPKPDVIKDVVYFLSVTSEKETERQVEEIDALLWTELSSAEQHVTFPLDKEVLRAAKEYAEQYLL